MDRIYQGDLQRKDRGGRTLAIQDYADLQETFTFDYALGRQITNLDNDELIAKIKIPQHMMEIVTISDLSYCGSATCPHRKFMHQSVEGSGDIFHVKAHIRAQSRLSVELLHQTCRGVLFTSHCFNASVPLLLEIHLLKYSHLVWSQRTCPRVRAFL